ncbi:hypothetical protein POM88_000305 [Heracleum sosnowskyi]|uniref:Uncharacterized protein n=1 Tax=Heracleum sosnowskyi TaxID=360622 RepID=A0AAD8JA34_9APIA|nr:hypothetical protein POM88_000305 [Heracleum sosnowskyi]
MDQTDRLTTAMNNITLDEEDEGAFEVEPEELVADNAQGDGFNANISSSLQGQRGDSPAEEDVESLDPKITPANMVVVAKGGNQGDKLIQKADMGGRQQNSNLRIITTELSPNQESNALVIIDNKRRRVGDGLEDVSLGLNTDMSMDSDDTNKLGYENTAGNSKNVYGASTQVGARLSL